jgi:myo-inositol-1(or 4)-monophosphatase
MTHTLLFLENLARQAGEIIRSGYNPHSGFRDTLHVEYKGAIDLVSEIDLQAEKLILDQIRTQFPGDSIVSEENGVEQNKDCCVWYVDPLDGTINYIHGLPIFCVSLAYAENGELKLGVVYDPVHDECFMAEQGKGAFLNGAPIRASHASNLNESLLVTGFSYDIRKIKVNNIDNFARFSIRARAVRRLGSAALDLCFVAAGRLDGFWELQLYPWDFAAGALIAKEAGALVTNLNGEPELLNPPYSILACTPAIQKEMLDVIWGKD